MKSQSSKLKLTHCSPTAQCLQKKNIMQASPKACLACQCASARASVKPYAITACACRTSIRGSPHGALFSFPRHVFVMLSRLGNTTNAVCAGGPTSTSVRSRSLFSQAARRTHSLQVCFGTHRLRSHKRIRTRGIACTCAPHSHPPPSRPEAAPCSTSNPDTAARFWLPCVFAKWRRHPSLIHLRHPNCHITAILRRPNAKLQQGSAPS